MSTDTLRAAERVHAAAVEDARILTEQLGTTQASVESTSASIRGLDPTASDREFEKLIAARDAARGRLEALEARVAPAAVKVEETAAALQVAKVAVAEERLVQLEPAVREADAAVRRLLVSLEEQLRAALKTYSDQAAVLRVAASELAALGVQVPAVPGLWHGVTPDDEGAVLAAFGVVASERAALRSRLVEEHRAAAKAEWQREQNRKLVAYWEARGVTRNPGDPPLPPIDAHTPPQRGPVPHASARFKGGAIDVGDGQTIRPLGD
jgi:hypothetical protein